MQSFDVLEKLRTYCVNEGIIFIPSISESYVNSVIDWNEYENNDLIMFALFNAVHVFDNSKLVEIAYTGVIGLGRKCESELIEDEDGEYTVETESNLDETPEQKYDRRLKYLANKLTEILSTIACENQYEIRNCNMRLEINKFDLNADFVACDITIA
ncbi:MAG: hypothetical protein BWY22_02441 [Bacteroidetes bacterium ADurb.Bin217]|nr:MAG: hypothetical protein BWY22_02441 [Bacteroidetes bacterium ADurb.Bin217]